MSKNEGEFVMEKNWEKIQQKAFTKWLNSHLRKRKLAIADLQKDLTDGTMLIQFLEIISNQQLGKYDKKPKIRIQKVGNVSLALDFLKSQKIQLVNISGEDIVDENLKLILGLIWTIIQKFALDDISEEQLSAKEALLLWCQKKTAGYKDVKVDNFTYSFQDGLALCALIHKHRPDLIDFNKLNKEDKAGNLQLAFDVADRDLNIPKLLDVEDMVDIKPDERSVITYVSQYYHVFSKYNQAEVAGRRIGKLVDLTETLEGMKNDYGDKAKKLVDWINTVTPQIQDRDFGNSLDGVRGKIDDFKTYKNDDKPPKTADKANVEALYNNIALKLRANNRPAFEAPAGLAPSDIDGLWNKLGDEERQREQALRDELRRQEKLDHLRRLFDLKAGKLEAWLAAKETYLGTEESVNSINEAQTKLKNHDAFDTEYTNARPRLDAVQEIAREFAALGPEDAANITGKSDELASRFNGLAGPQSTKRADLDDKLARENKKEELRKEFARLAKEYNNYAKEQSNTVNDHNFGDNLEAVQGAKSGLDSSDANVSQGSQQRKDALDQLWNELQALGVTENRYSAVTNKDIDSIHNHLQNDLQARRTAYDAEVQRQLLMEEKRKEFAAAAQQFVDSLNARKSQVESSATSAPEPEAAISSVNDTYQGGAQETEGLNNLNNLQNELSALGIRDNKYTQYNLPALQLQNQKFANYVKNTVASLKDEAELKAEYLSRAKALTDWANATLPGLNVKEFDNTLAGVRAQRSDWQKYLTGDKATHEVDRFRLEALATNISNLLSSTNRPAFAPPQPLDQASIASLFALLASAEKDKEAAINGELARQEKLATLVKRFNADSEELEGWLADKEAYLQSQETVDSLDAARLKVKYLEVFRSDFEAKRPALGDVKGLSEEIAKLNYNDIGTVQSRLGKIEETFSRFSQLADAKNADLQAQLAKQQANEDLRVNYANQARDYSRSIRDSVEAANDNNFGFSLEDVAAYQGELDRNESEATSRADQQKAALDDLSSQLAANGVSDNRHTTVTPTEVASLRSQLGDALAKRRQNYQSELSRQSGNEEKRKAFAQNANEYIQYVDQQKGALGALSGEPDERIAATNGIYQNGQPTQQKFDALAQQDAELKSLGVYDNRHTPYSLPVIQTRKNQYDTSVQNFVAGLNEEKELNERTRQLQAEYEKALKLENLRLKYAQEANTLNVFLESANETLSEPIKADSVGEVEELQRAFTAVESERAAQQQRYDGLVGLEGELQQAGSPAQPPLAEITSRFNSYVGELDTRRSALAAELSRQQNNESLRKQFAEKATALSSFIQEQSSAVNSPGTGSLEDQLQHVQSRRPVIAGASDQLAAVESLSQQLEEAGVTSNPHTSLSYPTLKVDYQELVKVASNKEALIQKEILRQSGSTVSAEQLAEFKEVFEYFDKDRKGSLDRLQFKSCLQSLGEDLADADLDRLIGSIGTGGRVPFDAFVTYMSSKAADSDNKPQILEAFSTLAGGKAFVTEDDLRRALPAEKVAYLVKTMPLYQGQAGSYDYTAFASSAFA